MAGFELVKSDVSDVNLVRTYVYDAAARPVAIGDCVVITGSSSATTGEPIASTTAAGANVSALTGVVVGIQPQLSTETLNTNGLAASTAGRLLVVDNPFSLFEVESDATLAAADVGLNCAYNAADATVSGALVTSGYTLDAATKATTATLPFQIVALLPGKTSGTLGDRALVRINASTVRPGATGV